MRQLDWLKRIDERPTDPVTRLAYADWLDEQGMEVGALAQRLLVRGKLRLNGDRWELSHHSLDPIVQVLLQATYIDPRLRSLDLTCLYVQHLYVFEGAMHSVAFDLLKNGHTIEEILKEPTSE